MIDWTPEVTELLTRLWVAGKSGAEIAREFGSHLGIKTTRNAIIGKVHRLGLYERAKPSGPRVTKAASRKGARRAVASVAARRAKPPARLTRPAKLPKPKAIPPEAPTPMNLTLMDLTSRTCKWPVNDPPKGEPYLFCGEAKEPGKEPYCPYHARLAEGTGTPSERRATKVPRAVAMEHAA